MMNSIVRNLLEITVSSSIMILIVLSVKAVFGNKIHGKMMSFLWLMVLARLLLPITFESPVHIDSVLPREDAGVVAESGPHASQNTPNNFGHVSPQTPIDTGSYDTGSYDTGTAYIDTDAAPASSPTMIQRCIAYIKGISIWTYGFALWLLGAGVVLLKSVWKMTAFKRKAARYRQAGDLRLRKVLYMDKKILGIRRRVRIVAAGYIDIPVTFGLIRPTILIPKAFLHTMDPQKIRLIIMHELCHIKRNDILKSYFWLMARTVHWFNPLIVLAFNTYKDDMELACDEMVIRNTSEDDKYVYTQSLLDVIKLSGYNVKAPLAIAFCRNKSKLKERVMNMLKPQKKNRIAGLISLLLAVMMSITCFTTACQPTPEKPIVQSKDNERVAQAIDDTETHTFSAPDSWQSQAKDEVKNIDLYVDAEVDVPTDTWGIYELAPSVMNEADLQRMITAIAGDATIYGEQEIRSKAYLLEQITRLQSQKAEFERQLREGGLSEDEKLAQEAAGNDTSPAGEGSGLISMFSEEDLKKNIEMHTNMINEAKAKLPTAPDEDTVVQHEFIPADMFREDMTAEQAPQSGFGYQNDGGMIAMSLIGTVDLGRDTPADIYISLTRGEYNHFLLNFSDYDDYEQSFDSGVAYTGQELFKCDINAQKAAQIARAKVRELGFDYLDIDSTYVSKMLDRQRKEGDRLPECFKFVFTRSMDGATATYAHGDGAMTEEKELALQYAPHWDIDEVSVRVDDSGVIGVRIESPKSDVARQAYGIELKDFEEIMDIFETQVFIENAFYYDSYADKALNREIHVDSIRLGYMPTAWKDHPGQIIYTPVWDFFGYEVVTYEDGIGGDFGTMLDEHNRRTNDLGEQSLLTINALDGTIMIRP